MQLLYASNIELVIESVNEPDIVDVYFHFSLFLKYSYVLGFYLALPPHRAIPDRYRHRLG